MRLFLNIPIVLENIIWEYTGLYKLRNWVLIRQIKHYPPTIVQHLKLQYSDDLIEHEYNGVVRLDKYVNRNDLYFHITKKIHQDKIIMEYTIMTKQKYIQIQQI